MKKPDRETLSYRPCVGIMLINREGRAFAGQRLDRHDSKMHGGEAWQMPQGGVDPGENLAEAAMRELAEETGVTGAEIVAEAPGWLNYDLPDELLGVALKGRFRGQTQKWFAMRFTGEDSDIRLDAHEPEFEHWQWLALDDLPRLIVPFKRAIYVEVVRLFAPVAARIARSD
jgi:putative (di)nucleoside polyphosphate hydrolase